MLAILQLILSVILTAIYSINTGVSFELVDILGILLVFLIANILSAIVILWVLVIFIYATEKIDYRKVCKHRFAHLYSIYLFRFFYRCKLIVTGKENLPKDKNFVVYANHIEYTDPIYIMQAYRGFPMAFVAKEPLFKYPILKNLMIGLGNLPITKFADRSALETILKAIKKVKNGMPMGIFPEGKRTYSNDFIEFKPGAFKLAQKSKADISPVCLYDMHELSRKNRIIPTKVYLHILPIVKYEDYKDMDSVELSKTIYKIINDQMDKFKERSGENNV